MSGKYLRGPYPRKQAVEVLAVHGVSCRLCTGVLAHYMIKPRHCPDMPRHCKRCGMKIKIWRLLLEAANSGYVPDIEVATGARPPFKLPPERMT